MDRHLFTENDIQTFFESEQSKKVDGEKNQEAMIEIEFEPEMQTQIQPTQAKPLPPQPNQNQDYHPLYPVKDKPNIPLPSTPPQPKPYIPPVPPPGALPKVENSYIGQFDSSKPSPFVIIPKLLGIFLAIFIISFLFLNGPALLKKINYFNVTEIKNKPFASTKPNPTPDVNVSRLIIPQIQVNAPIIWNINAEDITKNLEKGVVHYNGTALPNEVGNIFITGHSSYYSWAQGDYKTVFALLDKLKAGDKIYLQYKGRNLIYEVSGSKVVSPDDLSSLDPTTSKTLTLMTCVPVGTNFRRLIVTANQI